MKPSFVVLGAGALGSFFGALLSRHYDVLLVGRPDHVEQIRADGLHLEGIINDTFSLPVATHLTKIHPHTTILLATKIHDGKQAIISISDTLRKDSTILVLQNGLGQEDELARLVPNRVTRAVTDQGVTMISPGKIRAAGLFTTYLPKGTEILASHMRFAGLKTDIVDNIRQKEWEKFVINCVINGLGSILGVPNNGLVMDELVPIKKAIIDECVAVAAKEDIHLANDTFESIEDFIRGSFNVNSTLQDLRRGKKTEIDHINGTIVMLGRQYGVKTPVNETIWRLVKAMERVTTDI